MQITHIFINSFSSLLWLYIKYNLLEFLIVPTLASYVFLNLNPVLKNNKPKIDTLEIEVNAWKPRSLEEDMHTMHLFYVTCLLKCYHHISRTLLEAKIARVPGNIGASCFSISKSYTEVRTWRTNRGGVFVSILTICLNLYIYSWYYYD